MKKTYFFFALSSLTLATSLGFAQPVPMGDCHDVAAIPGTTPISCDVSSSRVEYQGTGNDMQISLSCLWTQQNGMPIADPRFYLTHAIAPRTGTEQITMRAGDKIVAILVKGNGPIQTEVLSAGNIASKTCASLDIASFSASGCVQAPAAISPQLIAETDSSMVQACQSYVRAMATGGSITAPYHDAAASAARLTGATNLANLLSR